MTTLSTVDKKLEMLLTRQYYEPVSDKLREFEKDTFLLQVLDNNLPDDYANYSEEKMAFGFRIVKELLMQQLPGSDPTVYSGLYHTSLANSTFETFLPVVKHLQTLDRAGAQYITRVDGEEQTSTRNPNNSSVTVTHPRAKYSDDNYLSVLRNIIRSKKDASEVQPLVDSLETHLLSYVLKVSKKTTDTETKPDTGLDINKLMEAGYAGLLAQAVSVNVPERLPQQLGYLRNIMTTLDRRGFDVYSPIMMRSIQKYVSNRSLGPLQDMVEMANVNAIITQANLPIQDR